MSNTLNEAGERVHRRVAGPSRNGGAATLLSGPRNQTFTAREKSPLAISTPETSSTVLKSSFSTLNTSKGSEATASNPFFMRYLRALAVCFVGSSAGLT
jgi:hypothetical protein